MQDPNRHERWRQQGNDKQDRTVWPPWTSQKRPSRLTESLVPILAIVAKLGARYKSIPSSVPVALWKSFTSVDDH